MNSWDRFLLVVWRCTIGPALFCLLLLCAIASFFLGGWRFFIGCWKMAMFSEIVDWDSGLLCTRQHDDLGIGRIRTTNWISLILWTLLVGLWLRILFLTLMVATHLLLFSDWLAKAMLNLADGARNPAYVRIFWTHNFEMDDVGRFQKSCRLFHPFEISRRSDLSKLNGGNWVHLLLTRPQFADKCDWSKLHGRDWDELLGTRPEIADKCDWSKLGGSFWSSLLGKQPQFADKCDWSKFDGEAWARLLATRPEFADKCDWSKLDGEDWSCLLCNQPQFADKCDKWDVFSSKDWSYLLGEQPQFADKCDKWDEFSSEDWNRLLKWQPQFKSKRCCE